VVKEAFNNRAEIYKPLSRAIYKEFSKRLPELYDSSFDGNINQKEADYANAVDFFQFHYVRYLCGFEKTRRIVFEEFADIQKCELFNEKDYNCFLREIERFLLERELYEAMQEFKKTNRLLKKRLKFN